MKKLLISVAALVFLSGCARTPPATPVKEPVIVHHQRTPAPVVIAPAPVALPAPESRHRIKWFH